MATSVLKTSADALEWKGPDFFQFFYTTTPSGRTLGVRYEENRNERCRGWVAYVGVEPSVFMYPSIDEAKAAAVKMAGFLDSGDAL